MHKPRIHIFDLLVRILLILLPFTTILSVFAKVKLGIPGFTYYKEVILCILFCIVFWLHIRSKLRIRWTWIDIVLMAYMLAMISVTFFTTGIQGLIYGGRYDFEFLLAFWVIYHGAPLLEKPVSYYLMLFLGSAGLMLFLSGLLKWPLSEDLLLYAGFCGNPSAWAQCAGIPPIFHGIDGANIRRFQGMLDGPNTMGAFLILFSGIFAYVMRYKKDWYFVTGGVLLVLFMMTVYTQSRSALIGMVIAISIVLIASLGFLWRKYRTQSLILCVGFLLFGSMIALKYADTAGAVIGRSGSTQGHSERMETNIYRFIEQPLGSGLGSSGPAYRFFPQNDILTEDQKKDPDSYYIPESWFIQQFVEGGFLGGILFILVILLVFYALWKEHIILGAMFIGLLTMNMFLHTFESSPLSLLLFIIIGIILGLSQKRILTR